MEVLLFSLQTPLVDSVWLFLCPYFLFLGWGLEGMAGLRGPASPMFPSALPPSPGLSALGGGVACGEDKGPQSPLPTPLPPAPSKPLTRGAKEEHGGLM